MLGSGKYKRSGSYVPVTSGNWNQSITYIIRFFAVILLNFFQNSFKFLVLKIMAWRLFYEPQGPTWFTTVLQRKRVTDHIMFS